jgi:hypothetical protein
MPLLNTQPRYFAAITPLLIAFRHADTPLLFSAADYFRLIHADIAITPLFLRISFASIITPAFTRRFAFQLMPLPLLIR